MSAAALISVLLAGCGNAGEEEAASSKSASAERESTAPEMGPLIIGNHLDFGPSSTPRRSAITLPAEIRPALAGFGGVPAAINEDQSVLAYVGWTAAPDPGVQVLHLVDLDGDDDATVEGVSSFASDTGKLSRVGEGLSPFLLLDETRVALLPHADSFLTDLQVLDTRNGSISPVAVELADGIEFELDSSRVIGRGVRGPDGTVHFHGQIEPGADELVGELAIEGNTATLLAASVVPSDSVAGIEMLRPTPSGVVTGWGSSPEATPVASEPREDTEPFVRFSCDLSADSCTHEQSHPIPGVPVLVVTDGSQL